MDKKRKSPREILAIALRRLIAESLGSNLKFTQLRITPDLITGKFVSKGDRFIFSAVFANNDKISLTYKPIKLARRDSADRFDKKKDCKTGVNCGDTCIEEGDVCHVGASSKLATPKNVRRMKVLAEEASKPDRYSEQTIRELKEEAKLQGVYRYGTLTAPQLRKTLRAVDKDPDMQNRVRKTLNRRKGQEKAVKKILPGDPVKAYKEFKKISKLAGINPELAAVSMAALMVGVTSTQFNSARDRYKAGLPNAARVAMDRARNVETARGNKKGILFAVGGFSNMGGNAQDMADGLNPKREGKDESWFGKSQEIIQVAHSSLNAPKPLGKKGGVLHAGGVLVNGFQKSVTNLVRGQNDAAVDLAARLYANGARHKSKDLNILTHGMGGMNVRAAGEVLRRMNPTGKNGPRGADIFQRLNVVNLGGPSFNFANDKAWDQVPFRTLTSAKDAMSILPKKFPEFIDSVKGGSVSDYLANDEVRERLRESFGFYKNSLGAFGKRQERRAELIGDLRQAANLIHPAAGRALGTALSIGEKFKDRPITAAALSSVAIGGGSLLAYKQAKSNYSKNLTQSASDAKDYAIANPPRTTAIRSQVVIAVGGSGINGKELRDEIANNQALTKEEGQQIKSAHFVEYNPSDNVAKVPDGVSPNSFGWAAHQAKMFYGNTVGKMVSGGKNPQAIQLAGDIYAQATKEYVREDKNSGRKEGIKLPVNVMAYGEGGLVAREAIDILSQMKGSPGLPTGAELLTGKNGAAQVKVVTMGTPSFGLSPGDQPETNIMANSDIWSKTPLTLGRGKTTFVSGVNDPSGGGYASSESVGKKVQDAFHLKIGKTSRRQTRVIRGGIETGRSKTPRQTVIESHPVFLTEPTKRPDWATMPTEQRGRLALKYRSELKKVSDAYTGEYEILKAQYAGRKPPEDLFKLAARNAIEKRRKIWKENGDKDLFDWPVIGRGARQDSAAFWAGYYGLRVDKAPGGKRDLSKLKKKEIKNKQGEKQTVWVSNQQEQPKNQNKPQQPGQKVQQKVAGAADLAKQAIGNNIADTDAAAKTAAKVKSYARKHLGSGSRNPEFDQEVMKHVAKAMTTGDLPDRQTGTRLMAQAVGNFFKDPVGEVKRGLEREAIAREAFKARFGEDAPTKADVTKEALKAGAGAVKDLVVDPETVVLAGGVAAGMVGGAVAGPAGALAGDLAGGLAARKMTEFAGKYQEQMKQINESNPEFAGNMGKLQKVAQATKGALSQLKAPEAQMELEDNMIGDASGWAIGNAVGKAANIVAPMTQELLSPAGLAGVSASGGSAALLVPLLIRPLVKEAHAQVRNGKDPLEATTLAVHSVMTASSRREQVARDKFKGAVQGLHQKAGEQVKSAVQSQAFKAGKNVAQNAVKSQINKSQSNRRAESLESRKAKGREPANAR